MCSYGIRVRATSHAVTGAVVVGKDGDGRSIPAKSRVVGAEPASTSKHSVRTSGEEQGQDVEVG
jgi:hypothetical protein